MIPLDFEKYTNSKLYVVFEFLYKIIFINIFWFVTTVFGLGIFTFMPAVITGYILIASVQHEREFPIFKAFFTIFKKVYIKSQKLFISLGILGVILVFNINFFYQSFLINPSFFHSIGLLLTVVFFIGYIFTCLYTPLIAIHFPRLSVKDTIKLSLLTSVGMLFHTILMIVIIIGLVFLMLSFPAFFPLLPIGAFSLTAYFFLLITRGKFYKMTKGKQPLLVTDFVEEIK